MNTKMKKQINGKRNRGSVLVMVVVLLVMMVLVGTAYMQVARVQRQGIQQPGGDIQAVKFAIIAQIQNVLKEDLIDQDGDFFNPTSDNAGGTESGFDESYDYPYTSVSTAAENQFDAVSPINGTVGTARGGMLDDRWLASTSSYDHGATAKWRHITNLNGLYLSANGFSSDLSLLAPAATPIEQVVSNNAFGGPNSDTDLALNNTLLVDGDGDGVPDSRWEWAPIAAINGIAYTMAVRITDLGARINVNTATRLTANGSDVLAGAESHSYGLFPTDADLSRLLMRADTGTNWSAELNQAMAHRGVANLSNRSPFGLGDPANYPGGAINNGRADNWLEKIRLYGEAGQIAFAIEDELELRHRNGLNDDSVNSTLEDLMPVLLRRDSMDERLYTDVATSGTPRSDWMQGGADGDPIDGRTFPDVRKMLTTASGASVFAANHVIGPTGAMHGTTMYGRPLRYDLKWGNGDNPNAWSGGNFQGYDVVDNTTHGGGHAYNGGDNRINRLRERFAAIYKLDAGPADNYWNKSDNELDKLAWWHAVMVHDYSDEDGTPTEVRIDASGANAATGVRHFGMERLPFIREVYAQARYLNSLDYWDAANSMPGMDGQGDLWLIQRGSECLAIELANPFDHPIRIDTAVTDPDAANVQLVVQYSDENGTVQPPIVFEIPDGTTIPPRGHVVIYSNPDNATTGEEGGGEGNDLPVDLGFDGSDTIDAGDGVLTFRAGDEQEATDLLVIAITDPMNAPAPSTPNTELDTPVIVELRVRVDNTTNYIAYDRMTIEGSDLGMAGHFTSATDPAGVYRHAQSTTRRDGLNNRYITNQKNESKLREPGMPASWQDTEHDYLGLNDKMLMTANAVLDAQLDTFQLAVADRPIFSVTELGIVPTFAFTENHTFTELFDGDNGATAVPANEHYLNFIAPVPATTGMPHVAMLMDQFTTLHPGEDGVDNDNADADNIETTGADDTITITNMTEPQTEEVFVPGLMNINTMPLHTMVLASSLPDSVADAEALMKAIVRYRDNLANDRTDAVTDNLPVPEKNKLRIAPGIASIGELMLIRDTNGQADAADDMMRYGLDGLVQNPASGFDLFPLPTSTGALWNAHVDSREERLARFQFLANNFTTRSDRFVAEVLIRGWNATDFGNNGDGAVEELRFISVFDRSGLIDQDSAVNVIGIRDLE